MEDDDLYILSTQTNAPETTIRMFAKTGILNILLRTLSDKADYIVRYRTVPANPEAGVNGIQISRVVNGSTLFLLVKPPFFLLSVQVWVPLIVPVYFVIVYRLTQ